MTEFFPSTWHALAFWLVGCVIDRLVVARLGWTLQRFRDWLVMGMAHWFWPLWLVLLGAYEAAPRLRRWVRIALFGWSA